MIAAERRGSFRAPLRGGKYWMDLIGGGDEVGVGWVNLIDDGERIV